MPGAKMRDTREPFLWFSVVLPFVAGCRSGTAYGRVGEDTAQRFPNAGDLSARRAKTPEDVEEMEC
jgi:hypothetical protein